VKEKFDIQKKLDEELNAVKSTPMRILIPGLIRKFPDISPESVRREKTS
jgi:hypothetical protein